MEDVVHSPGRSGLSFEHQKVCPHGRKQTESSEEDVGSETCRLQYGRDGNTDDEVAEQTVAVANATLLTRVELGNPSNGKGQPSGAYETPYMMNLYEGHDGRGPSGARVGRSVVRAQADEDGHDDVGQAHADAAQDGFRPAADLVDNGEADRDSDELEHIEDAGEDEGHLV